MKNETKMFLDFLGAFNLPNLFNFLCGIVLVGVLAISESKSEPASLKIDLAKSLGPIVHNERNWTTIKTVKGSKDLALLKALQPEQIRMFNLGHTSNEAGEAKALGAAPVVCVTKVFPDKVTCGSFNTDEYAGKLKSFLSSAKKEYPQMEYVEIQNEPDAGSKLCRDDYNIAVKVGIQVADELNKSLSPGLPKIRIGGPVITGIDSPQKAWITSLMDYSQKEKFDLGFITYHQYIPTPRRHLNNAIQVSQWLTERGLKQVPQLNTEWHYDWRNPNDSKVFAGTFAYAATYIMASHYFFAEAQRLINVPIIPFAFATNDYVNAHRSLVIASQTDGTDGTISPQYNVRVMQSMMKDNRVEVQGLQLDANGYGLGAIASADENGVTAILWNCFHECTEYVSGKCIKTSSEHMKSYDVEIELASFTSSNPNGTGKQMVYLMDETHSNYANSKTKQNLEMIEEGNISLSSAPKRTFTLKPNSVLMWKIEAKINVASTFVIPYQYAQRNERHSRFPTLSWSGLGSKLFAIDGRLRKNGDSYVLDWAPTIAK